MKLTLQSALCLFCFSLTTNLLADRTMMPAPDAPSPNHPGIMFSPPPDMPVPASPGAVHEPVMLPPDNPNTPVDNSVLYIQRGGVSGDSRNRLEDFIYSRFGKRIRYVDTPVLYIKSDGLNSNEQSELISYAEHELDIKIEFLSASNQ